MKCRYQILKKDSESSYIIFAFTMSDGKKTKISTGHTILKNQWSKGFPKRISNTKSLRDKLNNWTDRINEFIEETIDREGYTPSVNQLQVFVNLLKGNQPTVKKKSLNDLINKYLEYKETKVKSTETLGVHINFFRGWIGKLELRDLNKAMLNEFKTYLFQEDRELSSLNCNVKDVKAFLNWLYDNDHTKLNYSKFLKREKEIEKPIHTINEAERIQLENHKCSTKSLEHIRNLFILGCFTALRFKDLISINENNIIDLSNSPTGKGLRMLIGKTKKVTIIPLAEEALTILRNWNYNVPKISNTRANLNIKKLFKEAGINKVVTKITQTATEVIESYPKLYEVVSFHLSRRAFCTICAGLGISDTAIRSISGHEADASYKRYVNYNETTLKSDAMKTLSSSRSKDALRKVV